MPSVSGTSKLARAASILHPGLLLDALSVPRGWSCDVARGLQHEPSSSLLLVRPFSLSSMAAQPQEPLHRLKEEKKKYGSQVSLLRKQYAEEYAEKQREKARLAKEKRELVQRAQAADVESRKEEAAARRQMLLQQQEELRRVKETQRLQNEAWRLQREQMHAQKKSDRVAKLKVESRYWVRNDDLDRRIAEALADPYTL